MFQDKVNASDCLSGLFMYERTFVRENTRRRPSIAESNVGERTCKDYASRQAQKQPKGVVRSLFGEREIPESKKRKQVGGNNP